ncbi:MAG TPA: hypothetical protein VK964_15325 [Nocardioidaceae bacterium]|nr:hypothetical protein [Nocardioidaceae bacterium]
MRWFIATYALLAVARLATGSSFDDPVWAPLLLAGVAVAGGAQIWRYRRRASVLEREQVVDPPDVPTALE